MIFCLGPLSPYLHLSNLFSFSIPDNQRFIKSLTLGESHFIAILGNGSFMVAGSNEYG
jgi:hypothetical protein